MVKNRHRTVWEPNGRGKSIEKDRSYKALLERSIIQLRRKSLFRFCSSELVVVQEICVTIYLLERFHLAYAADEGQLTRQLQVRLDRSSQIMTFALFLVVFISSRAKRLPTQSKGTKVRQRLVDGILLAFLLRFMSSLLRSLTASYSSDTVQSLAQSGLLLHCMACDYSYANGKEPISSPKTSTTNTQSRPPFQGGTVALNAAFFSTILLVSRLTSNASAYVMMYTAIVLFAFYPVTRNAISASFPAHSSPVTWIITGTFFIAALLLMDTFSKRRNTIFLVLIIGFVVPLWKYTAQFWARRVSGLWIIPSPASMQLDYDRLSSSDSKKGWPSK